MPSSVGRRRVRSVVVYLVLAIVGLLILMPFFWMLSTSIKTAPEVMARPPRLFPHTFTLINFHHALGEVNYFRGLYNSLFIAATTTAITVFFSTMAGYGMAKFKSKGLNIVLYVILSALMLPPFVIAIPLYIIAAKLGAVNTLWGVIIPFCVSNFGIFLMRQYSASVPDDLLSAARVDGASETAILLRIIFPVVSAGCAALATLKFLMTWNQFFFPLIMLTSEAKMTLQVMLSTLIDFQYYTDYGALMAFATLVMLPVILLFIFFQRYLMEGVALSGMKA